MLTTLATGYFCFLELRQGFSIFYIPEVFLREMYVFTDIMFCR